jgi:type I restriction enzyme S subunit
MIADLKPYPEYKESGLPWANRVPSHWKFRRTKVLFSERVQKGFPNEPLLAATQSKGVVKKTDYGERTVTASKDFHLLKLVEAGDFVISLRSFQGGLEIAHCRGIISPAYTILKPRDEVLRPYFKQFFKSPDFIDSLTLFVTGIREGQNIDYERLSRAYLPVPPVDEQEVIGRFLDHWNGRLENAIRSKRRVIALLQEQKQAIIHQAVTRGLDPNVKLKDSGIPWLGEIPEHWEARKLGSLFLRHGSGTTPSGDAYYGGGVPWVMSGDLKDGILATTKRTVTESALNDFSALKLHPKGSLLVAMYGATIGKTGVLNMAACSNQACCALASPRPQVNPVFIQSIVIMARPHLMQQAYGGGQPNINAEVVRSLRVPLPPLVEQDSILAYVDRATAPIGTAIARFEREITLLREYRTRLTADVVTGKLDVRAAAAQLPEEAEDEPLPDPELPEEETETEEFAE